MPLRKSVIKVGPASRAVIIPASWLEEYERKLGHPINEILMEVNNVLTIRVPEDDSNNEKTRDNESIQK